MKKKVIYILLALVIGLLLAVIGSAQERTAMISGWAFNDLDHDGVRETGENGIPETVICLVGYDWCDHTEWGEYMFDMLEPGKYKVKLIEFPDGYHPTSRRQYVIELQADEIRTGVNFGLAAMPEQNRDQE